MKNGRLLVPLVVCAAFSAIGTSAAPVSRYVFGKYVNVQNYVSITAIDSDDNTYLAGAAPGPYPYTSAFVERVSKDGNVTFKKTFAAGAVTVATATPSGGVLVAGALSPGSPPAPTAAALQSDSPIGFLANVSSDGTLLYLATLSAVPSKIAVDTSGAAYVAGVAESDFQTTPGSFQTMAGDGNENPNFPHAFVAKVSPDGSKLIYATFVGPAPGQSPGVYQLNLQIPNSAATGTPLMAMGGGDVELLPYLSDYADLFLAVK